MPTKIHSIIQVVDELERLANMGSGGIPESNAEFMVRVLCHALTIGYEAERERDFSQGKLIFRLEEKRFFTIRSTKSKMWVEYNDPNGILVNENPYKNITLTSHTGNQHKKTNMNKSKPFGIGSGELEDVCNLVSRIARKE